MRNNQMKNVECNAINNLLKLIQRTDLVGDNKRKLVGPLILLLVIPFKECFEHI